MPFDVHEENEAGGRSGARWLIATAVVIVLSGAVATATSSQGSSQISVTEADGVYTVTASFAVTEPPVTVFEALTDYDRIPRFMPRVRTSNVLERNVDRVVVEQEADARFLMFSRRVHLILEVEEGQRNIRFRDRSGKSFTRYEGAWTLAGGEAQTVVSYQLMARPSFDVPGFLLKRLLTRDATEMIERLKEEIRARARRLVN